MTFTLNLHQLPDPQQRLPAPWQAYAAWLAAQANPPKSYRAHPFESEAKLLALKRDFEKRMGLTLEQYVRLKRVQHLLAPAQNTGKHTGESAGEHAGQGVTAVELTVSLHPTPLGQMLAVFSEAGLCLLEFPERKAVETELRALQKAQQAHQDQSARFVWRNIARSQVLQHELDQYFAGRLQTFATPLAPVGTPFQQAVWRELQTIPYGATRSYKEQAAHIGKPQAMRAVAAANGQNRISILIPCHRVIGSDGSLTGYGGGLARKQALLDLESGQASIDVADA
ncbi:MAG: methylated-DNA--[protein]-cysteine S-methyltransferase [Brachymonas sp.]|nr:methylated-DNA--[protein]-cysteine S-methyltransferase [Brachymonas sp.]